MPTDRSVCCNQWSKSLMVGRSLQTVCVLFSIFVLWNAHQVNAAPSIWTRSIYDHRDSSILQKLVVLVSRLEDGGRHRVQKRRLPFSEGINIQTNSEINEIFKRSTSSERHIDETFSLLEPSVVYQKRSLLSKDEQYVPNQRYKRSQAMENFQKYYQGFYKELDLFLDELVTKFVPNAPDNLKHLSILKDVLRPDDPAFALNDKYELERKYKIVETILELVLKTVGNFISSSDQKWLSGKQEMMYLQMALMQMGFTSLDIADDAPKVGALITGVGGISVADSHSSVNTHDLQAAIETLKPYYPQRSS